MNIVVICAWFHHFTGPGDYDPVTIDDLKSSTKYKGITIAEPLPLMGLKGK